MKKQQKHLYVVSPGGVGCTAFFASYEIDHLEDVPDAQPDLPVQNIRRREGLNLNWIVSTIRLPMTAGRFVRQRLLRKASNAGAAA